MFFYTHRRPVNFSWFLVLSFDDYYSQTLSNKADLERVMEYAVSGGFGKGKALMPVGMRSNFYSIQ